MIIVALPGFGTALMPIKRIQVNGIEKKKVWINGILLKPILNGKIATYKSTIKKAIVTKSIAFNENGPFLHLFSAQENPLISEAMATEWALRNELIIRGASIYFMAEMRLAILFNFNPLSLIARIILLTSSIICGKNRILTEITKLKSFGNFRLETNYHLLKILEIGGYLGYSRHSSFVTVQNFIALYENTPFAGININLQLLPLLVKNQDSRFDIYLMGRYGGAWYSSPEFHFYAHNGFYFNYSHGAGLTFYLFRHLGIFGEYCFGILSGTSGNLRCGLSVKF